jgi:glycosyltransferase involved in cell wall biosynthesis
LNLEEQLEVVLFVQPENQPVTAVLDSRFRSQVQTVLLPADSSALRWLAILLCRLGSWFDRIGAKKQIVGQALRDFRSWMARALRGPLGRSWAKFRKSPATGLPLLSLAGLLAASMFLVYWLVYAAKEFVAAGWRSLVLPWKIISRFERVRRLGQLVGMDPLGLAKEADCDVWLIPSLTFGHSLAKLKVATVVLVPESLPWQDRPLFSENGGSEGCEQSAREEIPSTAWSRADEATLCISMSPDRPGLLQVDPAKIRQVPLLSPIASPETDGNTEQKAAKEPAQRWLAVFREAVEVAQWRARFDHQLVEPWPRLQPPSVSPPDTGGRYRGGPRGALKVFIFLPQIYYGGVLQASGEIVSELAAINGERRRLDLTLGLPEGQGNTEFVERLGSAVAFRRMRVNPIRRAEVIRLCGGLPPWLADRPEHEFCFLSGAAQAAWEADAWFSLIDRFPLPLLPARPLGILVQDVIQRRHPEGFDAVFFRSMAAGMIPTARSAEVIVTMTPQTRDDVIATFGVDPARVRLIPVACNPHWHFSQVTPQAVTHIREPFILNVTNASPHKGSDIMLLGYAQLKRRLGRDTPQLVLCGYGTQGYSQTQERYDCPPWQTIRRLVRDLGLVESRDVVFLGLVNDDQLRYLYERCSVVVNAARYDNGCLCLAEGAYFGRPVVSSRYPAAEFHAQRFGYAAHFFPVGEAAGLAEALDAALKDPPATAEDIEAARAHFLDPEFSFRSYSERIYDLLIHLAEKGRRQKASEKLLGISTIEDRGSRLAS